MFRKMIPLAVAVVLVIGCKKKGETGGDGGDPGDPNATYTLKVREEQQGDKTDVTTVTTGVTDIGGPKPFKLQEDAQAEYTETILEMPAGATKPTKLTRVYRKATNFDLGAKGPKSLPYEGKTVTIEKKGAGYEYTADGKKLTQFEGFTLDTEFGRPDKKESKIQGLLPKSAVKVGETWTVDMATIKNLLPGMQFAFDESKSKTTGKLTRAYTQDGKPWGTIAFDFDMAVDPKGGAGPKGGEANGTVKITATLDAVIDGSAPDGTMKMTAKMDVTGTEPGKVMKASADMTRTKTVKTVK